MPASREQVAWIVIAIMGVLIGIGLLMPVVSMRRDPRAYVTKQNLKQFGLALHNYLSENQAFPTRAICDSSGKPLLSWRVAILPYLERESHPTARTLYERFHLNEPWDSPHNAKLIDEMPKVFRDPFTPEISKTHYQAVVGENTAVGGETGATVKSFTDGLSNTIMLVEADRTVIWTRPDDLNYSAAFPLEGLGHVPPSGFNALMADGSARFILESINKDVLRGLMTINGGESVTVP